MKRMASACGVLMALAAPSFAGSAADVDLAVDNTSFEYDGTVIVTLVSVRNLTDHVLEFVKVTCAYQDDAGRGIDTGTDAAMQLAPGARVYLKVKAEYVAAMKKSECYADFVHP